MSIKKEKSRIIRIDCLQCGGSGSTTNEPSTNPCSNCGGVGYTIEVVRPNSRIIAHKIDDDSSYVQK